MKTIDILSKGNHQGFLKVTGCRSIFGLFELFEADEFILEISSSDRVFCGSGLELRNEGGRFKRFCLKLGFFLFLFIAFRKIFEVDKHRLFIAGFNFDISFNWLNTNITVCQQRERERELEMYVFGCGEIGKLRVKINCEMCVYIYVAMQFLE